MEPKSKVQKKNPSPWCPNCDWYKGRSSQCPRCGFNEDTGKIEVIRVEKPVSGRPEVKKERIRKLSIPHLTLTGLFLLLLIGGGASYVGYQMMQKTGDTAKIVKTAPQTKTSTQTPEPTMIPAKEEATPAPETPLPLPKEVIYGTWTITYGNLSVFSNLHFIGEGDFNADGTYTITAHPREFDRGEGVIVYTGKYTLDGLEINGNGKSTIYQKGAVFGRPATDTITAQIDPSGKRMEGKIESTSGFHEGGGEGAATFEFVLEKG